MCADAKLPPWDEERSQCLCVSTSVCSSEPPDLPTVTSDLWLGPRTVHRVRDVLHHSPSSSSSCVCVCLDSCGCLLNHTQTLVTRRGEILIIPPPRLCCFHLSVSCRFYWSCLPFTVNLFPVTTAMESFAAPAACEECSEKPHVWCFSM